MDQQEVFSGIANQYPGNRFHLPRGDDSIGVRKIKFSIFKEKNMTSNIDDMINTMLQNLEEQDWKESGTVGRDRQQQPCDET